MKCWKWGQEALKIFPEFDRITLLRYAINVSEQQKPNFLQLDP
jgi:hypothetical protein